jgi:hypothetical protein
MNQAKDAGDEPGAKGPAATGEKSNASPDDNQLDIDLGRHLNSPLSLLPLSAQSILFRLEDGRQQGSEAKTCLAKLPQRDLCGIGLIIGLKGEHGRALEPGGVRFVGVFCLARPVGGSRVKQLRNFCNLFSALGALQMATFGAEFFRKSI